MDMMGLHCDMQVAQLQELLVRWRKLPNAMIQINGSVMLIELY